MSSLQVFNLCVGQHQAKSLVMVMYSRSKHAYSVTEHSKKLAGHELGKFFNSISLARYQDIRCIVKMNVSHCCCDWVFGLGLESPMTGDFDV